MLNIMHASFYRFIKTKDLVYSLMTSLLIGVAMGFTAVVQGDGSIEAVQGSIDNWMFFSFCIVIVFIAVYIGGDFKSKVIYYEIMSGHARWEVIIGRLIPCTIFSIAILTMNFVSNFGVGIKMSDWLEVLGGVSGVIGRYCLVILNALPFIVICIMLVFLTKSLVCGIALEWMIWVILQIPIVIESMSTGIETSSLKPYFLAPYMRQIMVMPLTIEAYIMGILSCLLKSSIIIAIGINLFKKSELK